MDYESEEFTYLTLENVIYLHELALEKYGGRPGRDVGKLEAKLALPMSGFGDFERYPKIEEKAAVYLYELAGGHCFTDGNKRTGFLATYTFLELNGYELTADEDETYEFTLRIANNKTRPKFEVVVQWIKENTKIKEE